MFPVMSEYLEPATKGDFKITHYDLTEERLRISKVRDMMNRRQEFDGQQAGTIVCLHGGGELMMSDTEMERRTNNWFFWNAHGDVLIGGLGLGMVLLGVEAKEKVKSITVIEKHQEIIDLVVPQLPLNGKVKVICGDVFGWYPDKGIAYDTIYFDIWNSISGDNYEEMKTLHRRFARRLNRDNPCCWMSCWRHEEAKKLAK